MLRLIVNPGTESAWEIPLQPGVTSLGRNPENNFAIEHSSVSSVHCQFTVNDSGVVLKDLGSINGTFVNDTMVEEARISNGQTIRLGDVVMRFESDLIPRARPVPGVVLKSEPAAPAVCKFHPHAPAKFSCPQCKRTFCELCVNHRQGLHVCRACGVECVPLKPAPVQTVREETFFSLARGAFRYPLKGDGLILLLGGGLLFLLLDAAKFILRFVPGYGWVALLLVTVFGVGYLTRYLQKIVTGSAQGDIDMPDWPDVSDYSEEVTSPFFQLVGIAAFCFAPAAALKIYEVFTHNVPWVGWAMTVLIMAGAVYFPMAFTAVALFDSLAALNPMLIIPSILKIPKEYALTIVLFAVVLTLRWLAVSVLPEFLGINHVLPAIIGDFLGLYLLAVLMRVLGLLYFTKKEKLGWF